MGNEPKMGRTLEQKMSKEKELEIQKALQEEDSSAPTDSKSILIIVALIVGVFAFAIAGLKLYGNYFTSAAVVNVDDLHKENLNGDLNEKEGYMYNGFSFVYADGLWWTEVNRFGTLLKIPLHFSPKEVESIPVTGTLDPAFNQGEVVYIAINPNITNKYYTLALSELNFNIIKGIDKNIVASCTEENYVCENRTIINCQNTQGNPVIELAVENQTGIQLSGTCMKIFGQDYELVKAVDKVLLQWYGVIKN